MCTACFQGPGARPSRGEKLSQLQPSIHLDVLQPKTPSCSSSPTHNARRSLLDAETQGRRLRVVGAHHHPAESGRGCGPALREWRGYPSNACETESPATLRDTRGEVGALWCVLRASGPHLRALTARFLLARESADGKWPAEEETVLREVVELPLGEEELDIGNHVCVIPCSVLHDTLTPVPPLRQLLLYNRRAGIDPSAPKVPVRSRSFFRSAGLPLFFTTNGHLHFS